MGCEIKVSVRQENIPPHIHPEGQKNGQFPYVDTQAPFLLTNLRTSHAIVEIIFFIF